MELALDEIFGRLIYVEVKKVSILVFVELALDGKLSRCGFHVFHVSILVFVELALDDHPQGDEGQPDEVSILVFVELALDADTASLGEWYRASFNPCFRGTCS